MHTTQQKVVIVNGSSDILALVDPALEAGHYDVVFVESNAHAYSQIKRVKPNLVILCMRVENPDTFLVLSMLKLDADTRDIPVVTFMSEGDGRDETEDDDEEMAEPEMMFAAKSAAAMN